MKKKLKLTTARGMSLFLAGLIYALLAKSIGTTGSIEPIMWYDALMAGGLFIVCWLLGYLSRNNDEDI